MDNDRITLLKGILKSGISPILLEDFPVNVFSDAVILESNCNSSELNGHYEETEFCPPNWYIELVNKSMPVLVINNINKIPNNEQIKFIEILKYNKISTVELHKNCIIVVIANNMKEYPITEEVYSLVAHI